MQNNIPPELLDQFNAILIANNAPLLKDDPEVLASLFDVYTLGQQRREIPIADYPKDINPTVLRWHHIWKCYVSVKHRLAYTDNGCEWIDGTLSNTWPESAFTPFYLLPSPPQI